MHTETLNTFKASGIQSLAVRQVIAYPTVPTVPELFLVKVESFYIRPEPHRVRDGEVLCPPEGSAWSSGEV